MTVEISTISLLDVATGQDVKGELRNAIEHKRNSTIERHSDSRGFWLYCRISLVAACR